MGRGLGMDGGWAGRLFAVLFFGAAIGLQAQPPAFTHLKRILVLDKSQGGATGHLEARRDLNRALAELAAEKGFEVVTLGQDATAERIAQEFSSAGLATYQVVVFSNNDGVDGQLPASAKASFEAYVRGGGGFVAMHAASAFIANWPFMTEALVQLFYGPFEFGGTKGNLSHDSDGLRENTETRGILAGLAAPAAYADEFYGFRSSPRGEADLSILVTLDEKSLSRSRGPIMGDDHPLVWAKRVGKGRVVSNSLGHSMSTLNVYTQHGGYLKALVYRTLRYAAGDFTGCTDPRYWNYNPDATRSDPWACPAVDPVRRVGAARLPSVAELPGRSVAVDFPSGGAHEAVVADLSGKVRLRLAGAGPGRRILSLPPDGGAYWVRAGSGGAVVRKRVLAF